MRMFVIDLIFVMISFYFFCLFMAHVLMYKPDPAILYQLKTIRSSFVFSVLGIGLLYVLNKINTPKQWLHSIYNFIFLLCAASSFAFLALTINN